MTEALYSLSTIGGGELWASSDPGPIGPPSGLSEIVDVLSPVYACIEPDIHVLGLTIAGIRAQAIALAENRPQSIILDHPTVVEDIGGANRETSVWHIPGGDLGLYHLQASLYGRTLLNLANSRVPPNRPVSPIGEGWEGQFCFFVTQVKPQGSRMEIHKDDRLSAIGNFSDPRHTGRTLWGHPDLLERYGRGRITLDMLLDDERTIVQRLRTGCAVAFDARTIPHVGRSDPGEQGWRVILDADFQETFAASSTELPDPQLYPAVYG